MSEETERWYLSYNGEDYAAESYGSMEEAVAAGTEMSLEAFRAQGSEEACAALDTENIFQYELSSWPSESRIYDSPPSFYVGLGIPWWPEVDPDDVIERAQDEAADFAGEYAEGWLDDVTTEESADLDRRIQAEFDEWLRDTHHEPGFFMVGASREIRPGEEAAK